MFNRFRIIGSAALSLTGALIFAGQAATIAPAHADQIGDMLRATNDKVAPSIVSIRAIDSVVVKANGTTHDFDVTLDFKGVVVSADGLVMCSGSYLSSQRFKDAMPSGADDVNLTPSEIRITVGNEPTEYYGTLAASDSNLGLAFVQIRDLKGRALPFVDFSAPATVTAGVGDPTSSVTRLSKQNDYAPMTIEDRIVAVVEKPRHAFVPEGYPGGLALPVYGPAANLIGVTTTLASGVAPTAEEGQSAMLSRDFDDVLNEPHSQYILPAATVAPLIVLAKTRAAALPAFVIPPAHPATTTPKPATATPPAAITPPATAPPTTTTPPSAPAAK